MSEEVSPSDMFDKLRSMVITLDPNDVGITRENFPHPVFGLLMETGFPEGSFTLVAIADGATSLYFSNGGGIIGGGEHDHVREATSYLLSAAQEFYEKGKKAASFPKPEAGQVIFYFITFDGVHSYSALEDDLGDRKDELSDLFFISHHVIAQLREIDEGRDKSGQE